MRPSRFVLSTVIGATVLLTASGCLMLPSTPEPEPAPAPVTTAPEVTADEEVEETEEESAAPAAPASGEITAPGTALAYGETATVPFDYGTDVTGQPLNITVTGVTEGAISDFEDAGVEQDFIDDLAGYTVYYINVEASKGEGATAELAYTSISSDIDLLDANGNAGGAVSIYGDFPPCNDESFDSSIDEGATVSTCVMSAIPNDVEPGSVIFNPFEGEYSSYDGDPVVWS